MIIHLLPNLLIVEVVHDQLLGGDFAEGGQQVVVQVLYYWLAVRFLARTAQKGLDLVQGCYRTHIKTLIIKKSGQRLVFQCISSEALFVENEAKCLQQLFELGVILNKFLLRWSDSKEISVFIFQNSVVGLIILK